jgi:hypothetical protein
MYLIIDKEKAVKSWVLPQERKLKITDEEKMAWIREYSVLHSMPEKEIKRVYSDLDPFGEEDWED